MGNIIHKRKQIITGGDIDPNTLWNVSQITTSLVIDFSNLSTITQTNGLISQVNDTSGNSRHLATTGDKPFLVEGASSKSLALFTGTQKLETSGNFPLTGDPAFSVFAVYAKTEATNGTVYGWGNITQNSAAFGLYDDGSDIAYAFAGGAVFFIQQIPTISLNIHCFIKSTGAINTSLSYQNDVLSGTSGHNTGVPNIASNKFVLGQWGGYDVIRLKGLVAQIIVVPDAVDTTIRQKIVGSLAYNWGLQSKLASDHPYKNNPPLL